MLMRTTRTMLGGLNAVLLCVATTTGGMLLPTQALGEAEPYQIPGDTRLVKFRFDDNDTYTVITRPLTVTDIALGRDEQLKAVALGDTIQWQYAKTDGHVFIKPVKAGLFTSATIVTDKRTYQLALRSNEETGVWYQRVSWEYPETEILLEVETRVAHAMAAQEEYRIQSEEVAPVTDLEQLNFDYTVTGPNVSFKPKQVFDDGRFTWIRVEPDEQELPALFIVTDGGVLALANYIVKKNYLVVQRRFKEAVLKVGKQEVRIKNDAYASPARWTVRSGDQTNFWEAYW